MCCGGLGLSGKVGMKGGTLLQGLDLSGKVGMKGGTLLQGSEESMDTAVTPSATAKSAMEQRILSSAFQSLAANSVANNSLEASSAETALLEAWRNRQLSTDSAADEVELGPMIGRGGFGQVSSFGYLRSPEQHQGSDSTSSNLFHLVTADQLQISKSNLRQGAVPCRCTRRGGGARWWP